MQLRIIDEVFATVQWGQHADVLGRTGHGCHVEDLWIRKTAGVIGRDKEDGGRHWSETYLCETLQNSLYRQAAFMDPRVVYVQVSILYTASRKNEFFPAGLL